MTLEIQIRVLDSSYVMTNFLYLKGGGTKKTVNTVSLMDLLLISILLR